MPIEKVIVNASPLILLFKSNLERLLPQLFTEITAPEAVWQEVVRGDDTASRKLSEYQPDWLQRATIPVSPEVLVWNLGDGESAVLSLALENKESYRAIVDDRAARRCAQTLGIQTLGTGGVLVLAKRRKIISSVSKALEKLESSGLYISEEIRSLLKKQADEL